MWIETYDYDLINLERYAVIRYGVYDDDYAISASLSGSFTDDANTVILYRSVNEREIKTYLSQLKMQLREHNKFINIRMVEEV